MKAETLVVVGLLVVEGTEKVCMEAAQVVALLGAEGMVVVASAVVD